MDYKERVSRYYFKQKLPSELPGYFTCQAEKYVTTSAFIIIWSANEEKSSEKKIERNDN